MRPTFAPRTPDYDQRVRESFGKQGVMRHLGAELTLLDAGYAEVRLPYRPEFGQQHGFFHAGIISTAADSAGGCAAMSLFPPGSDVVAVEFKVNFMEPAKGEAIVARAQVLRTGRISTVSIDVAVQSGDDERLCATMLQTAARVPAG